MPIRQYLDQTVVPTLLQGPSALVKSGRPTPSSTATFLPQNNPDNAKGGAAAPS